MVKHRKTNTIGTPVSVGGSSAHGPKKRFSVSKWALVTAFVVVFGGLGSYFVFASHADSNTNAYNLYRLVNSQGHMYTTSATEVTSAEKNGFKLEGTYPFNNEPGSDPVPVYGLVRGTSHFLTTTATEYAAAQKPSPGPGYAGEGIRFYGSSSAMVPAGYCRQTWYRLVNATGHLYTPTNTEATAAESNGYHLESSDAFNLDYACSSTTAVPSPTPKPVAKPTPAPSTAKTTPVAAVSCQAVTLSGKAAQRCNGTCPTGTTGTKASDGYYYCFKAVATPSITTVSCQAITLSGKSGQRCNGTCPAGTTGNKASDGYYYCFKPASLPPKTPVAVSAKDDGCGPSGTAASSTLCRCGSWTPAPAAAYPRSKEPRSTSEVACSHAPSSGNVNCFTPGQTVPITGGTKCLYDGNVNCTQPGYTVGADNNGLKCSGPGSSTILRNLKTCLYIGWSVSGSTCYEPSINDVPSKHAPKKCVGPVITTSTHEKDCSIQ